MKIVLGTRGSRLALAQAEIAKEALLSSSAVEATDIRIIKTTGDQRLDLRLNDAGKSFEKGLFTKELEQALLSKEIDLAVHSLKDLPTEPVEHLVIGAVLPREDPVDVLVSKLPGGLDALPNGSLIATASPRRAQQIRHLRPDARVCDVRGNVPTRLEKLVRNKEWSAIILARAGLRRLKLEPEQERLDFLDTSLFITDLTRLLPAAGQGAIALQCRVNDAAVHSILSQINDPVSWDCVIAEREFLRLVGGGCNVPIGVYARVTGDTMILAAIVFEEAGQVHQGSVTLPIKARLDAAQVLYREIYAEDR
ncbi:MAG: hydroxymethylbilane synthase [Verrucomicrobia bacterium]|nr:hydroxymethylbilane synthase [Verrucomicrobiota bacterium]